MRICISGRTEFDAALARAFHSIGISITNDPKDAYAHITRSASDGGITITNDMSEQADIYLPYAADITMDAPIDPKWKSHILYMGEWRKDLPQLSSINDYRVCFFCGDESWAENWCGTYADNYRNVGRIVRNTEAVFTPTDSMVFRLAQFLGKRTFTKIDLEQIKLELERPENFPIQRDLNNTIYDRARTLLKMIGGQAKIYSDLCEFTKEERIQCLA